MALCFESLRVRTCFKPSLLRDNEFKKYIKYLLECINFIGDVSLNVFSCG